MSIMVTGGAGYLGSHTLRELHEINEKIIVYDNYSTGYRKAPERAAPGCTQVYGDLRDGQKILQTLIEHNVDAVVHFAAFSRVEESMQLPSKYYENNVMGTISLLNAMVTAQVKNLVFSSTASVYGAPDTMPVTEECAKRPVSVYGRTKYMIETMLTDYTAAHGLRYIALRYFNAAGAHQNGDIGEAHNPETHLIPRTMQSIVGKYHMMVNGTDYDTPDGTCVRDYVHVSDLAEAHVYALRALRAGSSSDVFNLGNGTGYSIKEVFDMVEYVTGEKVLRKDVGRRPGDPPTLIASPAKIKERLGWQPKRTLEDIVRTAWVWHSTHPKGYDD